MSGEREILSALVKRMDRACDRTKAHRTAGVIVNTIDWHGLMDLAQLAKAALTAESDRS